jgi:hypothetical protein
MMKPPSSLLWDKTAGSRPQAIAGVNGSAGDAWADPMRLGGARESRNTGPPQRGCPQASKPKIVLQGSFGREDQVILSALPPRLCIRRLLQWSVLLAFLDVGAGLAADMMPPPIGRRAEYACHGAFGTHREYTVRSLDGDIVRMDTSSDGKTGYALKPFWMGGTRLYQERLYNGRTSRITSGLEGFAGLRTLTPETKFEGPVTEEFSDGTSVKWHVTLQVTGEHSVDDDILGHVDVIPIKETWVSERFTSRSVMNLVPSRSVVISWRQAISDGRTDECKLTALHEP